MLIDHYRDCPLCDGPFKCRWHSRGFDCREPDRAPEWDSLDLVPKWWVFFFVVGGVAATILVMFLVWR